uniref:Uncharacterized protein n=1 Tax=Lactuca sativa TaxID=4236 RepID=A0A9R1V4Y2_LACSA|nr:hypothetical protein LSAT_V11C700344480 [Lactuca sativa]
MPRYHSRAPKQVPRSRRSREVRFPSRSFAREESGFCEDLPDLSKNTTSTSCSAVRSSSDQEVAQGNKMDESSSCFVYKSKMRELVLYYEGKCILPYYRCFISQHKLYHYYPPPPTPTTTRYHYHHHHPPLPVIANSTATTYQQHHTSPPTLVNATATTTTTTSHLPPFPPLSPLTTTTHHHHLLSPLPTPPLPPPSTYYHRHHHPPPPLT